MAFVLFSAMRNEAPFLLDWVAYHHLIGFDRIVIVTNDCDDGSYELLDALSSLGLVEHYANEIPAGGRPQALAADLVTKKGIPEDGDWAIFLDADEYLNIHLGEGKVQDLASFLDARCATGMLLNWKLFGTSGQKRFGGSYIAESYHACQEHPLQSEFKTFFRKGPVAAGFSWTVHRCRLNKQNAALDDFISGSGRPLSKSPSGPARRSHRLWVRQGENKYSHSIGREIGYDIAQINHYTLRDRLSFALKSTRGRGNRFEARGDKNLRHTEAFFAANDFRNASDFSITRWKAPLVLLKQRWLEDPKLSRASAMVQATYGAQTGGLNQNSTGTGISKPNPREFPLTMPEGPASLLRDLYPKAKAIIEYGSGGSTLLATSHGIPCVSVESDKAWAGSLSERISAEYSDNSTTALCYVDIGPTGDWGYPTDLSEVENYWRYPALVWSAPIAEDVDLVLIDGRMRKACFASTLLNIKRPATVVFDDYVEREYYHEIETLLKPSRFEGRMAVFEAKPDLVSTHQFMQILPWFSDIR
jgi:glycosyltransferase involved in cell wall biosynthesis